MDEALMDALALITENGGQMARENCVAYSGLKAVGLVEDAGMDALWRPLVKLSEKGALALSPKRLRAPAKLAGIGPGHHVAAYGHVSREQTDRMYEQIKVHLAALPSAPRRQVPNSPPTTPITVSGAIKKNKGVP